MNGWKKIFIRKQIEIYQGWKCWHKCIKRYGIKDDTAFVIMPSKEKSINYYAVVYLNEYLKRNGFEMAFIVAVDRNIKKMAEKQGVNVKKVEIMHPAQIRSLVTYYCACNADRRMIVADIDSIQSRKKVRNLVGISGITIEKIIAAGVYRLIPFDEADRAPIVYGSRLPIKGDKSSYGYESDGTDRKKYEYPCKK